MLKKVLLVASALAILLLAALAALWLKPPELVRIGASYSAKIVCSNVFIAHRDAQEVLQADVQAPGHPLLRVMRVAVDPEARVVHAGLFGFIGGGYAVYRPGEGCAVIPSDSLNAVPPATNVPSVSAVAVAPGSGPWPSGEDVHTEPAFDAIAADDALAGPGMRAIVVVRDGRIVAERYADGFSAATPQLGWSMTKTVLAGLIGVEVKAGVIALDQPAGWQDGDSRAAIRVADLLAMSSGLQFNEGYGAVSDVTRMLYLESNMAAFARKQPLVHPRGEVWSYSSGTALILSRIAQEASATPAAADRNALFASLGMRSALIEKDASGTLVGSSYMYATPRDWARYGLLLAQDGWWGATEILPRGFLAMMTTPVAASGGQYGHGLVWLWGSDAISPGVNPDAAYGLPQDTFWMAGHDGQSIAIIPSRKLVVVRLGLTPRRLNYQPQPLVAALLAVTAP